MIFGILQPHYGEFRTGLYFQEYPEIGKTEAGMLFKYREDAKTKQIDDIIRNYAHELVVKTISTTYTLPWKSEAYVLLGDELWRIDSVTERETNEQAAMLVRITRKEYNITLRKVSNAIGISR